MIVPPIPRPTTIAIGPMPISIAAALRYVMVESLTDNNECGLHYDTTEGQYVSYMKPFGAMLPTVSDIEEIWVVNNTDIKELLESWGEETYI